MISTKTAQLVPDLSWYVLNTPINVNVLSLSADSGATITLPDISSMDRLPLRFIITVNSASDTSVTVTPFDADTINGSTDDVIIEDTATGYLSVEWLGNGTDWVVESVPANVAPSYKVYTALLTQVSTNAPSVTVLENTIGASVLWSYDGVGSYIATCTGNFTLSKTTINTGQNYGNVGKEITYCYPIDINTVAIETKDDGLSANEVLTDTFVEIRVYN